MGLIELIKKNYSQAVIFFEKAEALLYQEHSFGPFDCDQALFTWFRAQAYFQAGILDKAKQEFEILQSFATGRLYYGDVYIKSFYMIGRIAEHQGNMAEAIEQYKKFLDFWKDADPGIAEVEEARRRLVALQ